MAISTASWPLIRVMTSRSLCPRTIRAMSLSRTTPWPPASTMMSLRSWARSISMIVRTRYSAWPSWRRPPVRLTFSWARRATTCLDAQAQARDPPLVDLDLDLLLQAAGDDGRGHALDPLEQALDLALADEAKADELLVAGEADAHDGVERGVVAQEDGPDGVVGKLQQVEAFADVEGREVHVGAPAELERDLAAVGPGAGGDGHHAVDDADRVLHRSGEEGLDLGGGGALELGADGERGVGDVGKEVDGEVAEGDQAEDDRGEGEHRDRDRPARGEVDDLHGGGRGLASAAGTVPAFGAAGKLVGVVTAWLALPVHVVAAAGRDEGAGGSLLLAFAGLEHLGWGAAAQPPGRGPGA